MKTCSKCKTERTLDRFSINAFGKHSSPCKNCQSDSTLRRYNENKARLNLALSEDGTDTFPNETHYKKEIKCKDFSFFQHIL
jgi:hypothetical protein